MSTVRHLVRALGLQAMAGLAVWLVVAVVAANVDAESLDLLAVLLLLGQLVVVPLGLRLLSGGQSPTARALLSGGRALFRVGAVAALASLALPRGELAAAMAALYLLPALLVGASALLDARGIGSTSVLAGVVARLMLSIGALLFVLHRQDVAFAGLPELAVQVGAAHLHFVGFGLLLMAGALAGRSGRLGGAATWLLAVGSLPAAVGSPIDPVVEGVGAVLVTAGLAALVAGTFAILGDSGVAPIARRLLFVSLACAAFVGVTAVLSLLGAPISEIGSMVRLHGAFAAVGVVVIGLLGWRLVETS
jgi:YndJ-like protein